MGVISAGPGCQCMQTDNLRRGLTVCAPPWRWYTTRSPGAACCPAFPSSPLGPYQNPPTRSGLTPLTSAISRTSATRPTYSSGTGSTQTKPSVRASRAHSSRLGGSHMSRLSGAAIAYVDARMACTMIARASDQVRRGCQAGSAFVSAQKGRRARTERRVAEMWRTWRALGRDMLAGGGLR